MYQSHYPPPQGQEALSFVHLRGPLDPFCVCVCLDAFGSLLDEAGCLFERAFVITCVLRLLERVEEQDLGIYSTGH